ncbi:hypothetical protein PO909_017288 [Leuciscus waleckii]
MEKEEVKGKGLYRERLNNNARQLYLEKLLDINNMDPYDLQLQNGRKHYHLSHTLTLSITWFMLSVPTQCKSSEALSH